MTDIKELKDEELEKVSGGVTNTREQGPKYNNNTKILFYFDKSCYLQATGKIKSSSWDDITNQYRYTVDVDLTRFIIGTNVSWIQPHTTPVIEEDILNEIQS